MKPLVIDLFCGRGGWTKGFLAEGYDAIGFDLDRHAVYPGHLALQDVLTLHGSQFRSAAAIVASPPCQKYSYMAMPWTRAKDMAARIRSSTESINELTALFNACFRLQAEASEAAGRVIPMVVENVKGAQPWVGRAQWHYGSFYLWGDVPALMPFANHRKGNAPRGDGDRPNGTGSTSWFFQQRSDPRDAEGAKETAIKEQSGRQKRQGGGWFSDPDENGERPHWKDSACATRLYNSKSQARKEACAIIAEIPFDLAQHIAKCFKP